MKQFLYKLLNYETMTGAGLCPVYLERWQLLKLLGCSIYLHHFLGDDWSIDPHDHPRRFISIGLKGWYWEDTFRPDGQKLSSVRYSAPWLRSFPASHIHRIRAAECGNVWTLVIVLRKSRQWGFVRDGKWIPFKQYVFGGSARKACK